MRLNQNWKKSLGHVALAALLAAPLAWSPGSRACDEKNCPHHAGKGAEGKAQAPCSKCKDKKNCKHHDHKDGKKDCPKCHEHEAGSTESESHAQPEQK
jgi:hypothetical protein